MAIAVTQELMMIGTECGKIFSYDSKVKLKVTRFEKNTDLSIRKSMGLCQFIRSVDHTVWSFCKQKVFLEAFQMRTVGGRAMLPLELWWKRREWVWTFLGHHKRGEVERNGEKVFLMCLNDLEWILHFK